MSTHTDPVFYAIHIAQTICERLADIIVAASKTAHLSDGATVRAVCWMKAA